MTCESGWYSPRRTSAVSPAFKRFRRRAALERLLRRHTGIVVGSRSSRGRLFVRARAALGIAVALTAIAVGVKSSPAAVGQSIKSIVIHRSAGRSAGGKTLTLTGAFDCPKGQWIHLNVWVVQQTAGALGSGAFPNQGLDRKGKEFATELNKSACVGTRQGWSVLIALLPNEKGKRLFKAGMARACVLPISYGKLGYTDISESCRQVVLQ